MEWMGKQVKVRWVNGLAILSDNLMSADTTKTAYGLITVNDRTDVAQ